MCAFEKSKGGGGDWPANVCDNCCSRKRKHSQREAVTEANSSLLFLQEDQLFYYLEAHRIIILFL